MALNCDLLLSNGDDDRDDRDDSDRSAGDNDSGEGKVTSCDFLR